MRRAVSWLDACLAESRVDKGAERPARIPPIPRSLCARCTNLLTARVFARSLLDAIDGRTLGRRDGLGVWNTSSIEIAASEDARILLMEVPMHW